MMRALVTLGNRLPCAWGRQPICCRFTRFSRSGSSGHTFEIGDTPPAGTDSVMLDSGILLCLSEGDGNRTRNHRIDRRLSRSESSSLNRNRTPVYHDTVVSCKRLQTSVFFCEECAILARTGERKSSFCSSINADRQRPRSLLQHPLAGTSGADGPEGTQCLPSRPFSVRAALRPRRFARWPRRDRIAAGAAQCESSSDQRFGNEVRRVRGSIPTTHRLSGA